MTQRVGQAESARTTLARFIEKTRVQDNGCVIWVGSIASGGYGKFYLEGGSRRNDYVRAHRWAYEHYIGPIPDGLVLDHLCRNRACVNPDHLEAVTQRVNILRGLAPAAENAQKTHCPEGHPFEGDNLLMDGIRRRCRICRSEYMREYQREWQRKRRAQIKRKAG